MAAGEEKVFEGESRSEFKLDAHLQNRIYEEDLRPKTWSKGENKQ